MPIYAMMKTTSAVTQVVGGGCGQLASDTDGLAGDFGRIRNTLSCCNAEW